MLPRLDLDQRFTVQGPIPVFNITTPPTVPGGVATTREVQFGRTFSRSLNVTSTFDSDPFGRRRDGVRAARAGEQVAMTGIEQARNELVYAVQATYLAALRSRALIRVAREAIEASQEQQRVAEAQFRAGTAPEFDVLRASVQVANNRQTLVSAEASYRRTLGALGRLLGEEVIPDRELAPVEPPPATDAVASSVAGAAATGASVAGSTGFPLPNSTLEQALAEAFTRRPEVIRAEWTRKLAETRVKIEKKGNAPGLGLAVGFQFNPDQAGFAVVTKTYSIIANLTIPLFDGGVTQARTRQARAGVDEASAQLRAARTGIADEVRTAFIDLSEASDRRKTAGENTRQAREALRIARVRYNAGLAQNVEITDAQVALTLAQSNEVNAGYDYLTAVASFNRSVGRLARISVIAPKEAAR